MANCDNEHCENHNTKKLRDLKRWLVTTPDGKQLRFCSKSCLVGTIVGMGFGELFGKKP